MVVFTRWVHYQDPLKTLIKNLSHQLRAILSVGQRLELFFNQIIGSHTLGISRKNAIEIFGYGKYEMVFGQFGSNLT